MALIVQKFGGSSLAGPERLLNAADIIAAAYSQGNSVIAVLSARGDTTDRLLAEAQAIHPEPPPRELDLLLSVGEQISVAHMAMELAKRGLPAVALTGWQAGIRTDSVFGDARVHHVTGERIRRALAQNKIVLVTGFQGISEQGDITTLGRGGSDTTAVALAAFLGADACYIYTDVAGIYTADPRELSEARKLDAISYADMLMMAQQGAKVLHSRCVELAMEHQLTFEVRSSFTGAPGTVVGPRDERRFCGIAVKRGIRLPTVEGRVSRISVIGAACGEKETAVQVLRALGSLPLCQLAQKERCVSAYVPEEVTGEAARILHYLFLS
ncbi:MAG: aspartate kinase [Oscillospiraceae bacterium]|nr:aspartate kinase [Oscillospiraceae bacterium]